MQLFGLHSYVGYSLCLCLFGLQHGAGVIVVVVVVGGVLDFVVGVSAFVVGVLAFRY
jgi:hypothetical protein